MTNEDISLDNLFKRYKSSCPDLEPSVNFMPNLWQKIESRRSFGSMFQRFARPVMTASAALCLLLAVLNLMSGSQARILAPTYTDALLADHSAEKTYYTEAIWTSSSNSALDTLQQ